MRKNEVKIEEQLIKDITAVGGWVRRIRYRNRSDCADLLVAMPDQSLRLVEIKDDRGELSAGQLAEFKDASKYGVHVTVVYGLAHARRVLKL